MQAADVMQKGVISVSPELGIGDFEQLLVGEDVGGAPVVGTQGELVGVVSKTDIVRALSEEAGSPLAEVIGSDLRVSDIMTRDVLVVAPDTDVREIARRMLDAQVHRVLVCDGDDIIGIVTTFDLLRAICEPAGKRT